MDLNMFHGTRIGRTLNSFIGRSVDRQESVRSASRGANNHPRDPRPVDSARIRESRVPLAQQESVRSASRSTRRESVRAASCRRHRNPQNPRPVEPDPRLVSAALSASTDRRSPRSSRRRCSWPRWMPERRSRSRTLPASPRGRAGSPGRSSQSSRASRTPRGTVCQ
jgi:hypothetical protein